LKAARLHTLALYDAIHLLSSIEPTSSLRRLTLSAITEVHTGPLYDFLRSCTGIEELIFHCDTDHGRTMELEDPIHLGTLLKLEIDSDTAGQLLGLLRAPNLQSAVLCYDPTDWQPLRNFFSVARTSLSRLALSTFHLSCPLLHDLMSTLSGLETLGLENCNADGGLWVYLTPEEGSSRDHWKCPKLRHLDVCRTAVGADFVELIRRRADISAADSGKHSDGGCHVDIKLRQCNIPLSVAKTLRDLHSELGPFITGISAEDTDDSDSGESLGSDLKASGKYLDHWDD